jgi:hypothetical protein
MIDRQTVDGLLEQAYGLIQQGDAEQAIVVGNQLLEHRHARGFEIIAWPMNSKVVQPTP